MKSKKEETIRLNDVLDNYRKVASNRPVYYSIFEHFWGASNWYLLLTEGYYIEGQRFLGATNRDGLQTEMCYCSRLYGIQPSIIWVNLDFPWTIKRFLNAASWKILDQRMMSIDFGFVFQSDTGLQDCRSQGGTQLIGRLFSPSQKMKKWTHPFWLCFELGMGIYNHHAKY